ISSMAIATDRRRVIGLTRIEMTTGRRCIRSAAVTLFMDMNGVLPFGNSRHLSSQLDPLIRLKEGDRPRSLGAAFCLQGRLSDFLIRGSDGAYAHPREKQRPKG